MHTRHGLAHWKVRRAHNGISQCITFQRGVQGGTGTHRSHGARLDAPVHLIKQATDASQAEIPKGFTFRKQGNEGRLPDTEAEGIARCPVQGSGWPLADHGGQRKTLTLADFEGRFGAVFLIVVALATNPPLFDYVESFYDVMVRREDNVAIGVKLNGGILGEMRQMRIIHAGKGRMFPQKRHYCSDVLGAIIFRVR